MTSGTDTRAQAIYHFRRALSRAYLEDILARLTGRNNDLIPFEEARRVLKGRVSEQRELREIPLVAIVGSVGRYTDFTRQFLPRRRSDEERWARVMAVMDDPSNAPPILVYQIGEVYFVLDGNHRVSVARQRGASHILAYVTRVHTRVPLAPDTTPDELIRKAEEADFYELTDLDRQRPGADLRVTNPGQYREILADIEALRQERAVEGQLPGPAEAAALWYDSVYLPIVAIIRERGMLHDFPGRTETDLYVWISRHRAQLEAALGWALDPEVAAADLMAVQEQGPLRAAATALSPLATTSPLNAGPPPGQWRQERGVASVEQRLSADVLVPLSGAPESWPALEQAIVVARRESGRLHGLHVVPDAAARSGATAIAVQAEFERRCRAAGVSGQLAIEIGAITPAIVARARWSDLVVVRLAHPPGEGGLARLRAGFHALVQHCPRPILAVPGPARPLNAALLCYDGTPKANEALFAAAYLALQWAIPLTVLTVLEPGRADESTLARARRYLEAHGVSSVCVAVPGPPAATIVATARERACDLILIGGYGHGPLLEAVLGGTVDEVLRSSDRPVLICR
ncbi:MAG: universal stress protein [Chloroflexaceae bacterium]